LKYADYKVLRVTLTATGFLVLAFFLPNASWQLLFVAPFFSVANGLSQAFLTTIVSRSAGESVQGEILGINASVTAVAQAIPPVVAGISRRRLSHRPRFTSLHCSSFCRELYSGSFLSETIELQRSSCT
jgi:MFS family permease